MREIENNPQDIDFQSVPWFHGYMIVSSFATEMAIVNYLVITWLPIVAKIRCVMYVL